MHKSHTWHCIFRKHDLINLYNKRASNSKFDWGSINSNSLTINDFELNDDETNISTKSYGLLKVSVLVETLKENESNIKLKNSLLDKILKIKLGFLPIYPLYHCK